MKNSCQNCNYREVGCHSKCNNYQKYKEELNKINDNRKDFNEKIGITLRSYRRLYI